MSATLVDDLSAKDGGGAVELNSFVSLGIVKTLCDCIDGIGWKVPTDIQRMSIPEGNLLVTCLTVPLFMIYIDDDDDDDDDDNVSCF